jgi:hypothetical protein
LAGRLLAARLKDELEVTMKWYNRIVRVAVLASTVLLSALYFSAEAQQPQRAEVRPIPAAAVACYFVARAFLSADFRHGEVVGYFTDINGIGDSRSLFNGPPSEKTAYFTLRSDVLSVTPLPANGDVVPGLVSAGTFDVYYNPVPKGDWSNPDTFSSGRLVARFMRPETLVLQILQTDTATPPPFESLTLHTLTETLLSSKSFTFKGHKYDLGALAPGGLTLGETASNTGVRGVTGFPIGQAFGGHCLAVGGAG